MKIASRTTEIAPPNNPMNINICGGNIQL